MAYDTIMQVGSFTATGENKTLQLRADVDFIEVWNQTVLDAAGDGDGAQFYFQRGMTNGRGLIYVKEATIGALVPDQLAAGLGFNLINSTENVISSARAITSSTDATTPVFSVSDTSGLSEGTIVRVAAQTGQTSVNGFDFEVTDVSAGSSFKMRYAMANDPGVVGSGGTYRIINFDPQFYPRRRFVVKITQASQAVVTTSVRHGYVLGEKITLNVSAPWGMTEINGMSGTVVARTDSTFTLDIDSSTFTAFTFPLPAAVPFTFAEAIPAGMNTAQALSDNVDILGAATVDTAYLGVELVAGTGSPAGVENDVIFWRAGRAFSVDNE